ncbi:serine/threonine protein kinase (plasmid) [Saccharobesus litoralis]|uniref:Serine/threonine protein kinase n=1 Tax=Saccharobesus litoralis TaxID=2172099 RepID=A0A2S0VY98_9ALTE|nr:type II toxin-antitoxin system HipA family toxin [Saccharobesus litoralis]AWB69197.1 serine/threonine protein kinase [Saccharobesus litoralis]
MVILNVFMNGFLVGELKKSRDGGHSFTYSQDWLDTRGSRPISLSMPLRKAPYMGDIVYNYFDNLLPDLRDIRERIVTRYNAESTQVFDLLSVIGRDCVGALQLMPNGNSNFDHKVIKYKSLTNEEVSAILTGYQSNIPLGMLDPENDFRISIAGAQEKTALLRLDNQQWARPEGTTPTTHIFKLPIGAIQSHSHTIDLSDSVENEYLCLKIMAGFGIEVPECEIFEHKGVKALVVERFDRKRSSDKTWIMRLPQEDFCQVNAVSPSKKYESDGGPGIKEIMAFLLSSAESKKDRRDFMKTQVLFWLLGATDGHAKNFSVYLMPNNAYKLTPIYDVLSAYPACGGCGLNKRKLKLAMALKGKNGKKYDIFTIHKQHFITTAKHVGFNTEEMNEVIDEIAQNYVCVLEQVEAALPTDFPERITRPIIDNFVKLANSRLAV